MLWPKPRGSVQVSRSLATFLPGHLHFRLGGNTPSGEPRDLMNEAIDLYMQQLRDTRPVSMDLTTATMEHRVDVLIDFSSSDSQLKLDTEESYQLVISTGNATVNDTRTIFLTIDVTS